MCCGLAHSGDLLGKARIGRDAVAFGTAQFARERVERVTQRADDVRDLLSDRPGLAAGGILAGCRQRSDQQIVIGVRGFGLRPRDSHFGVGSAGVHKPSERESDHQPEDEQ